MIPLAERSVRLPASETIQPAGTNTANSRRNNSMPRYRGRNFHQIHPWTAVQHASSAIRATMNASPCHSRVSRSDIKIKKTNAANTLCRSVRHLSSPRSTRAFQNPAHCIRNSPNKKPKPQTRRGKGKHPCGKRAGWADYQTPGRRRQRTRAAYSG
jgi:hypothetical protein